MSNIEIISKEIDPIIEIAKEIEIKNEDDVINASKLLSSLTIKLDILTSDKEAITKPINESLKAIRAKYKPLETTLDTSISLIRSKLSNYQTFSLIKAKEEKEKIANRIGEGKGFLKLDTAMNKINDVSMPVGKIQTDRGQISFRTDRVLNIIDIKKIPDEFFDLNETKLLKALKEGKVISGANLKEVQTVITKI